MPITIKTLKPFLYVFHKISPFIDISFLKFQNLGDGMTGIAINAKSNDQDNFGSSVNDVSHAVCGLVEAAAQVWDYFFIYKYV